MKYIGVKIVEATPMTAADAANLGYKVPEPFVQEDGYEVTYPGGYKSWCPYGPFMEANRPTTGMPFGHAIEAVRQGHKIARAGWNGKGMWLRIYDPFTDKEFPVSEREPCEGTPIQWIGMKTAQNTFVPWLASQTDMLADDWMIVE